jgi:DNA-binding beta-propeller fold protein YncE
MFRKPLSLNGVAVFFLTLGLFMSLYALNVSAQDRGGDNFVYVMTNKNPANSVMQFRRAADGSLSLVREAVTGGGGTGADGADPLGSQDSLVLSGDGQILLAANAGSNEVSVFSARNGQLRWLSKSSSGGTFPNSVALSGDLVYVLNAQGTPNITGFRLDSHGILHWITTVPLPPGTLGPNDVRFTPDGAHILLTASGSNQILVFDVADDGVAAVPLVQASAGGAPFGIRFGHDGVAVVSEAAGSASSYRLDDDTLNLISGAVTDTQKASCWISVDRAARTAYLSNTASGTISSFQINGQGALALSDAVAAKPGGAPIDSALSRDGRFLYVVESAQGKALIFRSSEGSVLPVGSVAVPLGSQGIAAQ